MKSQHLNKCILTGPLQLTEDPPIVVMKHVTVEVQVLASEL